MSNKDRTDFLFEMRDLAQKMDDLIDQYNVREDFVSIFVAGLASESNNGDLNLTAMYKYDIQDHEQLDAILEFVKETCDPGPDLSDLLGGLDISLN